MDKAENTLVKVGVETVGSTFTLHDGEVIVGFKSFTDDGFCMHLNFQFMVMRDIEAEELE